MSHKTSRLGAFTVLEMTIATLILLVAISMSARLLQDTAAQIAWSGRKAVEVSPDLALEQLRTDLRSSAGVLHSGTDWIHGPMAIVGSPSGLSIVYEVEEGLLIRSTESKDGVLSRRIVLDRVVDFAYRAYFGTVELEVAYLRMSPLLRKDTAVGTREAVTPEQRKISLWVSPRRVPAEFF